MAQHSCDDNSERAKTKQEREETNKRNDPNRKEMDEERRKGETKQRTKKRSITYENIHAVRALVKIGELKYEKKV